MTGDRPAAEDTPVNAPRSLADLFWSLTVMALQGFGGVLAVVQRELVEKKRWLTREQFIEDWAVAQILPGPNVVNLSMMIGARHFGLRGGLVALAGILCVPTVIVLALAVLFAEVATSPVAQGALRGMGAVAAGLVVATGLKLIVALRNNTMGPAMCALLALGAFICIAWFRFPLVWVLLGLGGTGSVWAWMRLGKLQRQAGERALP